MRVGLFTESYDPIINGVSTSVKTLAAQLARNQHAPVVVAPRFPGFADEGGPCPVVRLPSWRTLWNPQNPFAYPPVGPPPHVLRGVALDIVHTQQPFGMGMHGRRIARLRGIPLVSTFHTLYTEYAHYFPVVPRSVAHQFLNTVLRRYYDSCDAVIVPSREAGRRLETIGLAGGGRLHVVPTGVAAPPAVMPAARDKARAAYDLPLGAPVLLFVGRLAKEKNLELLFDAFARLVAGGSGTPPVLLLVGSGPHREACEAYVKHLGLTGHVRFAGFLSRNDLAPVYELATLFCFPSSTETQGVVLSEAQSHGLPCVLVEGGGASEFVRPDIDALVVKSGADAFTRAIQTLLDNPNQSREFAAAALASPLRPTPDAMVRLVVDVYNEVLGRGERLTGATRRDIGK